jgi:chitinase
MRIRLLLIISIIMSITQVKAQSGHDLIGYWHNWNDASAPYISLDQVDSRYTIIDIAFAVPAAGTDYKMTFTPDQVTPAVLLSQIQQLQSTGKKVLISIGGATAPVALNTVTERDTFVSTMTSILTAYGFDGMDIDLEGSSLALTGGTISQPTDATILNLIDAVDQIMINYRAVFNRKMMLTMAPEAAFVQGGMSAYGGIWGAYLPVIDALRDSLDILHVQLYNTGSLYGIDGGIYTQGTADFIVAMTEAVIQGFNTGGGPFAGLPASKVAVGLPACPQAAGGGFADTLMVKAALDYLTGNGPKPGIYTLAQPAGYPQLRGMMTWSVNWDAVSNCYPSYSFAGNYQQIFGSTTATNEVMMQDNIHVHPNPASSVTYLYLPLGSKRSGTLFLTDMYGRVIYKIESDNFSSATAVDLSALPKGMYAITLDSGNQVYRMKVIKQ